VAIDIVTTLVVGLCDSLVDGLCDSLVDGLCDSTGTVGTNTADVEEGGATRGPAGFGPVEQSKPI